MNAAGPTETGEQRPRHAFTQGVGTVFQFVGVMLFVITFFICCGSGLLDRENATARLRTEIGWHLPGDPPNAPSYSIQRAVTLTVAGGIVLGLALACVGLGLQATRRNAPWLAVITTLIATSFWAMQMVFSIRLHRSIPFTLLHGGLFIGFGALLGLSLASLREMWIAPPPRGHELLPSDYKIPYSHLHQDPPEVRLAAELSQRRARLEVQQKELEMLEAKMRRTLKNRDDEK